VRELGGDLYFVTVEKGDRDKRRRRRTRMSPLFLVTPRLINIIALILLLRGSDIVARSLSLQGSKGCGKTSPVASGQTSALSARFEGDVRTWRMFLPRGYDANTPIPVVISTHGWGGDGLEEERYSGLVEEASKHSEFIAVFPDGFADNVQKGNWGSWNAVGSTQSPHPTEGHTCYNGDTSYCYESCDGCKHANGCSWTTCKNDVTKTGIGQDADGFLPGLLTWIERNFCVDVSRVYSSGMSNGAMFSYQLGVSMSNRFAAIAPVAGSFHRGYLQSPTTCVPVLDLHGSRDYTVPANASKGSEYARGAGWYYEPVEKVLTKFATMCDGCTGNRKRRRHFTTKFDGQNRLSCVSYGCDSIVQCTWNGGHTWPEYSGALVWSFLKRFTLSEKDLLARSQLPEVAKLSNIEVLPIWSTVQTRREFSFEGVHERSTAETIEKARTAVLRYGNPRLQACRKDEVVVQLSENGLTCSPVASANCSLSVELDSSKTNGCPTDHTPSAQFGNTKAYPTCIQTDASNYNCVLTCGPCRVGGDDDGDGNFDDCSVEAHAVCPGGSRCVVGVHRHLHFGVCAYGA